jgi:hypothetical protein
MTNEPSKETIMKTIHITTDEDIEIRVTKEPVPKEMTLEQLVAVIEDAITRHATPEMTRGDREIFSSLISEMYHHETKKIVRLVLMITFRPLLLSETQKMILNDFDQDFGLFALMTPLEDDSRCAHILSRIACDTFSAYLAPLTKFYTFDRIDELLEKTEDAFCDALETINIDAFF